MPDFCRSCKAPIRWAISEAGKPMPFNPEPDAKGEWRFVPRAGGMRAKYVPPGDRGDHAGRLFAVHWWTCPNAEQHRRPHRGRP